MKTITYRNCFLRITGLALVLFSCTRASHAQAQAPAIHGELNRTTLSPTTGGSLGVTAECAGSQQDQIIEVTAPAGFTVTPQTYSLGTAAGTRKHQFEVQPPHSYVSPGRLNLTLVLRDKTGELASEMISFEYQMGLSLRSYFLLGVLGIGLGYLVRLIVDSLNALPKPVVAAAAVVGAPAPNLGWFSVFIKNHYYLMDFVVTLLLGFLFLTTLVKDNHAPDTGMYWYSSLTIGFGVGLLTNSDLITRLRTK